MAYICGQLLFFRRNPLLLIRGGIHLKVNLVYLLCGKAQRIGAVSEMFRPQKYVSFNRKAVSHTEIAPLNVKSIPNNSFSL